MRRYSFAFFFFFTTLCAMKEEVIDIESMALLAQDEAPKTKMHMLSWDEIGHIAQFIDKNEADRLNETVKKVHPRCLQKLSAQAFFHSRGQQLAFIYLDDDANLLNKALQEKDISLVQRIREHLDINRFEPRVLNLPFPQKVSSGFDRPGDANIRHSIDVCCWLMVRQTYSGYHSIKNLISLYRLSSTASQQYYNNSPSASLVIQLMENHENMRIEQNRKKVACCTVFCLLPVICTVLGALGTMIYMIYLGGK